MTTISATMIADSVGAHSPRVSTILTRSPRWIHAEGRTHRRVRMGEELEFEYRTPSPMEDPNLSRNASSSRAVPVPKMIEDVLNDPAVPLWWGANQPGMQAHGRAGPARRWRRPSNEWFKALGNAVQSARRLHEAGAHKQLVNRLIEPFSHINVLWTGTQWTNFLALRDHEDAEPHIRKLAQAIRKALDGSKPTSSSRASGICPCPALGRRSGPAALPGTPRATPSSGSSNDDLIRLSVARCASAQLPHGGRAGSWGRDDAHRLYDRLLDAQPIHASPAEHQAKVDGGTDGDWPLEDARNPKAWARPEFQRQPRLRLDTVPKDPRGRRSAVGAYLNDRQRVELHLIPMLLLGVVIAGVNDPDHPDAKECQRLLLEAAEAPFADVREPWRSKLIRRGHRAHEEVTLPYRKEGHRVDKVGLMLYWVLKSITDCEYVVIGEDSSLQKALDIVWPALEHVRAGRSADGFGQEDRARNCWNSLQRLGYYSGVPYTA